MKLTIIPDDSFVAIDGNGAYQTLDLTTCNIPENIHALQWFDTKGWIEFDDPVDPFSPKPQNEIITSLPAWANAATIKWNESKAAELAAIEAERIAAEEADAQNTQA